MSSDLPVIELIDVWKKYSRTRVFRRTLKEDISRMFSFTSAEEQLQANEFWAVQQVNLRISGGETVGLYGPNGAGKSTILKLIAGVTCPTHGSVKTSGKIAPLLEMGAGFHPDFSGRENIFVNGAVLGMRIREIRQKLERIIEFSGARDFIDMPVKRYSSGMYVRLAFSIAIHSDADIYLFDEAIAVGDEDFRKRCFEKIDQLRARGKTILLVSQELWKIKKTTSRVVFMDKGSVLSSQDHVPPPTPPC